MTKTAAQLDAEIASALSKHDRHARIQRQQRSKLHPVEGLQIPEDSRMELVAFWRAHPALRKGCLRKYGFDPIDEEEAYWRFGLAEPDHQNLLLAVRRNHDVFSLPFVKRWKVEEMKHAKGDPEAVAKKRRRARQDHAEKKRIPGVVKESIEAHALTIIQGMYRHHEMHGGKEPCLTVGLITDHLRQAHMPDDFRWSTKDRQRTWTRSVLESMRRRGLIGSSFAAKARCYEPKGT
jgi:hypothetical protein